MSQNQTFIIKAKHCKYEYGQSEKPKDGSHPSANGGLIERKYNPIISKKQNEEEFFKEEFLREEIKQYINKNPKVKKELNINDIEIYDMTKTELTDLYLLLGLDIASISNAKKLKLRLNLSNIEPYVLFIITGISALFILLFEIFIIYKKKEKKKTQKHEM